MPFQPQTRIDTRMPRMNISPPIVGVPDLPACQVGPSSRMLCPALSLRSSESRKRPVTSVMRKLTMQAAISFIAYSFRRAERGSFVFYWLRCSRTTCRSSSGSVSAPTT